MSQTLVYLLLALALLLPIVGAVVLRLLSPRLTPRVGITSASIIFALAISSVLVLARSNVSSLQVGRLTLLLPVTLPAGVPAPIPFPVAPAPAIPADPARPGDAAPPGPDSTADAAQPMLERTNSVVPTAQPTLAATASPPVTQATAELTPTLEPTLAPTATAEPTPEPTPEPAPAEAPPAQRTYVVQEGDSLRGIAEQFNVSVADLLAANDLTAEEADSIRPGQELIIP